MNERLKELAMQAGITFDSWGSPDTFGSLPNFLERFAELVRQDEREANAKLCDLFARSSANVPSRYEFMGESAEECAKLIRARVRNENAPLP